MSMFIALKTDSRSVTLSLGPGTLATETTPFVLKTQDWLTIQLYVLQGMALPTTDTQFRAVMNMTPDRNIDDFAKLITLYGAISAHTTTWQTNTYPATVALANDIVHYATQVPAYYGALNDQFAGLSKTPPDPNAVQAFTAIITRLSTEIDAFVTRATDVSAAVTDFVDQTTSDLGGPTGVSTYYTYYDTEYGNESTQVTSLKEQLAAETLILDSANAEYKQDVIIASTTVTYAWVPFYGLIAAAVVAGVYGDRAVKALQRATAAQNQINTLNATIAEDANIITQLTTVKTNLTSLGTAGAAALTTLQVIQGGWNAIKSDLVNAQSIVESSLASDPSMPILISADVQTAISQWQKLSAEADAYRLYAYVTVTGTPAPFGSTTTGLSLN
jgi:Bacillus haemolytic enterotoxin (HBL)